MSTIPYLTLAVEGSVYGKEGLSALAWLHPRPAKDGPLFAPYHNRPSLVISLTLCVANIGLIHLSRSLDLGVILRQILGWIGYLES